MRNLRHRDPAVLALFVATLIVAIAVAWSIGSPRSASFETTGGGQSIDENVQSQNAQSTDADGASSGGVEEDKPDGKRPIFTLTEGKPFLDAPGPGEQGMVRMVDRQGRDRYALVVVPAIFRDGQPLPVVLGLGGWTDTPENFRAYSQLELSDAGRKALVVYPQAVNNAWEGAPYAESKSGEDVQFLIDLSSRLAGTYAVDSTKIGAVGMSNGGGMAVELACRQPGFLRGIVAVSGAFYSRHFDNCTESQVDSLVVHGRLDGLMDYGGGVAHGAPFLGVEDVSARLARLNGCDDTAERVDISDRFYGESVERLKFTRCGREIELWTLPNEGHTWFLDPDMAQESVRFLTL